MLNLFLNNIEKQLLEAYIKQLDMLPSTLIRITVRNLIDPQTILNENSLLKMYYVKTYFMFFLHYLLFKLHHVATYYY